MISPDGISVETVLTSMDGSVSTTLDPQLQPEGTAAYYEGPLVAGFYFLETTVYDDGTPVAIEVGSVQVVPDEESEVTVWIDRHSFENSGVSAVTITVGKTQTDPHVGTVYYQLDSPHAEEEWSPMYRGVNVIEIDPFTDVDVRIELEPESVTTVEYLWYINGNHHDSLTSESFSLSDIGPWGGTLLVTCIIRTDTGMSSFQRLLDKQFAQLV